MLRVQQGTRCQPVFHLEGKGTKVVLCFVFQVFFRIIVNESFKKIFPQERLFAAGCAKRDPAKFQYRGLLSLFSHLLDPNDREPSRQSVSEGGHQGPDVCYPPAFRQQGLLNNGHVPHAPLQAGKVFFFVNAPYDRYRVCPLQEDEVVLRNHTVKVIPFYGHHVVTMVFHHAEGCFKA